MKKSTKISMLSIAAVLVVVIALSCVLVACNKPNTGNNTPATEVASSVVNIDINPSVELVLDQNNCVMKANAENADAQILLQKADGIVGANVSLAASNIGSLAIEMKYVEENSSINFSVVGKSDINVDQIKADVKSNLETAMQELNVKAEAGLNMAIKYELISVKKAYPNNQALQGLDPEDEADVAHYRLMRSAMVAKLGLTYTEAAAMTNDELIQIVENAKANTIAFVDTSVKEAYDQAIVAYTNAKDVLNAFAYPLATTGNNENQKNAYKYLSYHIQELCMKQAYDVIKTNFLDKTFDDAQIDAIAKKLYTDPTEQKAFINGSKDIATNTWTKSSVMHYMDMQYRRAAETEREDIQIKYENAVSLIEEDLSEEHSFKANAQFDDFKLDVKGTFTLFPGIVNAFSKLTDIGDNILSKPINETPVAYEERIAAMSKKANDTLADLQANMNDRGKEGVETFQNNLNTIISKCETAYVNATKEFTDAANAWLDARKAERLELAA